MASAATTAPPRSSRGHGEAMRFVPVKSEEQQAAPMPHKTRELPVKQQTLGGNSLRGHLSESGMIAAKGIGRAGEPIERPQAARRFRKPPSRL